MANDEDGTKGKGSMMNKFTLLIACSVISAVSSADDFDDMFSDDPFSDVEIESVSTNDSAFSMAHDVGFTTIVNVNSDKANVTETLFAGMTSAQLFYKPSFSFSPTVAFTLSGEFEFASDGIFWLRADDHWSDDDIDKRQYQTGINELIAQYRLSNWQLSTGVQSVTLGLADALSVSNVLNAQDMGIPGAKDLDESVIPAWTSLASGELGLVRIKAGVIHAHQVNQLPPVGTDFDTGLGAMLKAVNLPFEAEPLALENAGAFASFSGVVGPLDWQLNAITQLEHSPVVEIAMTGMGPVPKGLHFPRTTTLGVGGSYVMGSLLWKGEVAWVNGLKAQSNNTMLPGAMVSYQRTAGTAGVDVNHASLGRMVAELQISRVLDYDSLNLLNSALSPAESTAQWVLMYSKNWLRDSLTVQAQMIGFDLDASGGRIQGLSAQYDVSDQTTVSLRLIDYVAGNFTMLKGTDDRDRVIASVNYRF